MKKIKIIFIVTGIIFLLAGFSLFIFLRNSKYPYKILNINSDKIQSITLKPYFIAEDTPEYQNVLFCNTIEIKERDEIQNLCTEISLSKRINPNHPNAIWKCIVTYHTNKGAISFCLSQNMVHGILVEFDSNVTSGFHYGTFRNDKIERILRKIGIENTKKQSNKSLHRTAEPLCNLENKEKK